ncbi:MAG: hypothetical protein HKK67_05180 [Chlorobiaceae bacterium]|nr:hypothetical protein [Chlorobiaceae bacterium]
MKKNILLVLGIAGMMIGCSEKSHSPEVKVQTSTESTPSFVIDSPPNFIYLKNQGFSVSKDSPYDIISFDGNYYINNNAHWYRSSDYHGPWILIQDSWLPSKIGRYSMEDIRRYRDIENRKPDKGNRQYQHNNVNTRRILDQRNQRNDANDRNVRDQQYEAADNRNYEPVSRESSPSFVIDSPPRFIYLRDQGFSVSNGSSVDIVYYGDSYYTRHHDHWYRSSDYHGPWIYVQDERLPSKLRRHSSEEIKRYRDIEYRRQDSQNNQYQREDDNKRRVLDQRNEANSRTTQPQQNKAPENVKAQVDQHKGPDHIKAADQPHKVPENVKAQVDQHKGPDHIKAADQPHKVPENVKVQVDQHKGPDHIKVPDQSHKTPENSKVQVDQHKTPDHIKAADQPHKAPENVKVQVDQHKTPNQKKTQDQPHKAIDNSKNQDHRDKVSDNKKENK